MKVTVSRQRILQRLQQRTANKQARSPATRRQHKVCQCITAKEGARSESDWTAENCLGTLVLGELGVERVGRVVERGFA